jgi:transposase
MNTTLHAVSDADGSPVPVFMTAGQVSDDTGAAALLSSRLSAVRLLADRGFDADSFGKALKDRGTRPSIPHRTSRGRPVKHDKRRSKRRNRIEIMFGQLKDWRRVATRYDRCPKVFLSAVALAAIVISGYDARMSPDPGSRKLTIRHISRTVHRSRQAGQNRRR